MPSSPRPRYIILLRASFPHVQGSILDIARPPGASVSGLEKAPDNWKSGNVMAISRIVNVEELRTLVEIIKPKANVNIAISDVVR